MGVTSNFERSEICQARKVPSRRAVSNETVGEVVGGYVEGDKVRNARPENAEEEGAVGGTAKIVGLALFIEEEVAGGHRTTSALAIVVIVLGNVREIFNSK